MVHSLDTVFFALSSMRPAITRDHQAFFASNGWIAFEDAFSNDRGALMLDRLLGAQAERLHTTTARLGEKSPLALYEAGTDLWRISPEVRALAGDHDWAQLMGQLLSVRQLRLAGDQLWTWRPGRWSINKIPFAEVDLPWMSLSQIVSCDGLLAGIFFTLEGGGLQGVTPELPISPFGPTGSAVIVRADLPLSLNLFRGVGKVAYCVLVFGRQGSYRPAPYDPQPNRLKQMSYTVGQTLSERTHPILWTG